MQDSDRLVQIPEESRVRLLLRLRPVAFRLVAEISIDDRAVDIRNTVHSLHLQDFGHRIHRGIIHPRGIFELFNLRHDIGIGISPIRPVPAILEVIVGIAAPAVVGLIIVHIAAEHIGIQVLHQLIRPVLPFPEVVVEIDTLLDNIQRNTQIVEIDLHIFVGNTGLVRIDILKVSGTGDGQKTNDRQAGGQDRIKSSHIPMIKIHI